MKAFAVLVSNCAGRQHLLAEHGLSLYIRHNENDYLFDTGGGALFIENANFMNLPIEKIKFAVLSHNHTDHVSGIPYLSRHFSMISGVCNIFHASDFIMPPLPSIKSNVIVKTVHYDENCAFIFSETTTGNETIKEISLLIESHLFMGCGHSGVEFIVEEALKVGKISSIAGGFHNFQHNEVQLKKTAHFLKKTGITCINLMHCSSMRSIRFFEDEGIDCKIGCVGQSFLI